jgi:hypothetical protein
MAQERLLLGCVHSARQGQLWCVAFNTTCKLSCFWMQGLYGFDLMPQMMHFCPSPPPTTHTHTHTHTHTAHTPVRFMLGRRRCRGPRCENITMFTQRLQVPFFHHGGVYLPPHVTSCTKHRADQQTNKQTKTNRQKQTNKQSPF